MLSPEVGPRDDSEYIGKASGLRLRQKQAAADT